MTTVEIYDGENTVETLEMDATEVQAFINLIKTNGYLGENGVEYHFGYARMNPNNTVCVVIDTDDEG